MSDARMKALEAVAEAVRTWCKNRPDMPKLHGLAEDTFTLFARISTLDTQPALAAQSLPVMPFYGAREPSTAHAAKAGKAVTLAVWERASDGAVSWMIAGSDADKSMKYWTRLGTVTLPLAVEPGA